MISSSLIVSVYFGDCCILTLCIKRISVDFLGKGCRNVHHWRTKPRENEFDTGRITDKLMLLNTVDASISQHLLSI